MNSASIATGSRNALPTRTGDLRAASTTRQSTRFIAAICSGTGRTSLTLGWKVASAQSLCSPRPCLCLSPTLRFDRSELPQGDVGVFGARDWPRAPAFEPRFDLGKIPDDASG